MYEVEVKVRADHDEIAAALRDRDAERVGRVVQEDTYYDAPHRDFAETDEAFRIRREWDDAGTNARRSGTDGDATARVTYKGPLLESESKSREEFETTVAEEETMAAIVERLGFDPAATVRKDRTRFRLDGYTVTLDDVDGLGEFVEVETETEEEDITAAREGARDMVAAIGPDPDEQIRTSYLGLLLDAGEESVGHRRAGDANE